MEGKLEKRLYIASWLIAIIPYLIYAIAFRFLPSEIPAHMNSSGITDRWMSKTSIEVMLFCSISLIMICIINPFTYLCMKNNGSMKKTTMHIVLLCNSIIFVIINVVGIFYMWIKAN